MNRSSSRAASVPLSGTYDHQGGATVAGRRTRVGGTEPSDAALRNPIYRLNQPVFVEEEPQNAAARRVLRFSLAIDIDGAQPLNVVSGSIVNAPLTSGELPVHFIGRVTSNKAMTGGRRLTVTDVDFEWPGTSQHITRLDVAVTRSGEVPQAAKGTSRSEAQAARTTSRSEAQAARTTSRSKTPVAKVTFVDVALKRKFGPFVVPQSSKYFHEVEVDVDREANAIDIEPLSTHVHPDRPADLPESKLTLESAFASAGVRITRSVDRPKAVTGAGGDHLWNLLELHDSMVLHWEAFANRPQWKMWIFLAERADDDGLGGVMFDGDIDEPGGVDRQGTALFTRCPFFHTPGGGYPMANPPAKEAVKRELFFNLIHETGHAFNLAHSFQKHLGGGWAAPEWMPLLSNKEAMSWMNYPDAAAEGHGGGPLNASWFYKRFRFQFDRGELLFLRHAPERYVQMGAEAWFENHARVAQSTVDPRLQLSIRTRKTMLEHGEPVILELKLKNVSDRAVAVHRNLDPSDGLVDIAITNPRGERRPFLPFDHTRTRVVPQMLQPGGESIYVLADVTMGAFGFHFKEPGAYRIEASYANLDGRTAAAVLQLYVRPALSYDAVPIINEMFDARIGRALYVEGTRVQDGVNDKIDWIRRGLAGTLGERNPIEAHLRTTRFKPLMRETAVVKPEGGGVRKLSEDPEVAVNELQPVLIQRADQTADTMGHIWYVETVNAYARAADDAGETAKARDARVQLSEFCRQRGIVASVAKAAAKAAGRYQGT